MGERYGDQAGSSSARKQLICSQNLQQAPLYILLALETHRSSLPDCQVLSMGRLQKYRSDSKSRCWRAQVL